MTITKLAKLAGTTRPTIYKYFEKKGYDKKNINENVIRDVIDHFSKRTESNKKLKSTCKRSSVSPRLKAKKLTDEEKEKVK